MSIIFYNCQHQQHAIGTGFRLLPLSSFVFWLEKSHSECNYHLENNKAYNSLKIGRMISAKSGANNGRKDHGVIIYTTHIPYKGFL